MALVKDKQEYDCKIYKAKTDIILLFLQSTHWSGNHIHSADSDSNHRFTVLLLLGLNVCHIENNFIQCLLPFYDNIQSCHPLLMKMAGCAYNHNDAQQN